MIGYHWARNFNVTDEDVETLSNHLLEVERPLTTEDLALVLINQRLDQETAKLRARYKDTTVYKPSETYDVGARLLFSEIGFATATVVDTRPGDNPDYGDFQVIKVEFDDDEHNTVDDYREFASALEQGHILSENGAEHPALEVSDISAEKVLEQNRRLILNRLDTALGKSDSLLRLAGYWFPQELVMDIDIGTLHLSEAVLDINGGGPMTSPKIIEEIGGLGDGSQQLQVFSLNLALSEDKRFDEVGPAGDVMWFLTRMEPEYVRGTPPLLAYKDIPYDEDLLSDEMYDLETELDDEWTPIDFEGRLRKATTTLIYPHRRAGTLPLNAKTKQIFPKGRTARIHVELVDETDGETFNGWVVHEAKYVYGLEPYFTKHRLPVGAFISVKKGEAPGQIIISHEGYKPRTEYIRLLIPQNNTITFENKKRQIGAEFDDLIIIGVDDIEAVDKLAKSYAKKALATILRDLINALAKLTPQGTVHAVTLYSAANVLRRCAPGPLFATLSANPDFEEVGNHYWTMASD
jgi:hypothetical protein